MNRKTWMIIGTMIGALVLSGCETTGSSKDRIGNTFGSSAEAEWIRNGEPIEFEGEPWYPTDSVENILDTEVYPIGEYHSVTVFIEYTDVRPYDRLYTRFRKNQYRTFEKKT